MKKQNKIDILTKDWIQRDGNTFTYIRRTDRLGWERIIPDESAYSSAIMNCKNSEELFRRSMKYAQNMLAIMRIPHKVKIILTQEDSSTDYKKVFVATSMFNDDRLNNGEKLDVFTGLTIHEGCHLLYTQGPINEHNRIIHDIWNIIEDERIELLCGEKTPGLANFLSKVKYYYFDNTFNDTTDSKKKSEITDLFNTILALIRYPKSLKMELVEKYCNTLIAVRKIIDPFPTTREEAHEAAKKIYQILLDFMKNNKDSESKNDSDSQESSKLPESQQDGNQDKAETQQEKTEPENKSQTDESKPDQSLETMLEDILDQIEKISGTQKEELEDSEIAEELKEDNNRQARILQGDLEEGSCKYIEIIRPEDNQNQYNNSLQRIKQFVPAVKKIIENTTLEKTISIKSLKNGILDTNKLAEAYQGVPTIYMRNDKISGKRTAVCILLDQSGSMRGYDSNGIRKINAAQDTVILLNEALGSIPNIDLFIYGHNGDEEKTKLHVYREKKLQKKYALGSIITNNGNIDSVAIRESIHRVRQHSKEKIILFVISDGMPCEGTTPVKTAVAELERQGVTVISVGIEANLKTQEMYKNHIHLTDMRTLAPNLSKMIKKTVLKYV